MAEHTLRQMYRGGIFDHIGYGFCRYSTDGVWLVPHFEKMLYDNALLLICYLDLYWITKRELYKNISEKIMYYLIREMRDSSGLFYSAQDADSDGEEGKYYVFTFEEIRALFSPEDAAYFSDYFAVTPKGNFEGKNIPHLLLNASYETENKRIQVLIEQAYAFRQKRTSLLTDDKFITSWNAMAIYAFAMPIASWVIQNILILQLTHNKPSKNISSAKRAFSLPPCEKMSCPATVIWMITLIIYGHCWNCTKPPTKSIIYINRLRSLSKSKNNLPIQNKAATFSQVHKTKHCCFPLRNA